MQSLKELVKIGFRRADAGGTTHRLVATANDLPFRRCPDRRSSTTMSRPRGAATADVQPPARPQHDVGRARGKEPVPRLPGRRVRPGSSGRTTTSAADSRSGPCERPSATSSRPRSSTGSGNRASRPTRASGYGRRLWTRYCSKRFGSRQPGFATVLRPARSFSPSLVSHRGGEKHTGASWRRAFIVERWLDPLRRPAGSDCGPRHASTPTTAPSASRHHPPGRPRRRPRRLDRHPCGGRTTAGAARMRLMAVRSELDRKLIRSSAWNGAELRRDAGDDAARSGRPRAASDAARIRARRARLAAARRPRATCRSRA